MDTKRTHRLLLSLLAMLAGSISLVAVSSSPASAATATTTVLTRNYTSVKHGVAVTFEAGTYIGSSSDPQFVGGTLKIQRLPYGSSTWATIFTRTIDEVPEVFTYKPSTTARYRAVYVGNSTYATSVSSAQLVSVKRNLHDSWRSSTKVFYGQVTPNYGGRTVYIQKSTCSSPTSSSCSWVAYKTLRTTSAGNWSIRLPAYARRTHFRGLVKASNGYLGSYSNHYVTTYRY